MDTAAFYKFVK